MLEYKKQRTISVDVAVFYVVWQIVAAFCEAISMMTVYPVRMMGLSVKKGELKAGFDADICVFDEDINIKTVLCGGKPI